MMKEELLAEATYWQECAAGDYRMLELMRNTDRVGSVSMWMRFQEGSNKLARYYLFKALDMEG